MTRQEMIADLDRQAKECGDNILIKAGDCLNNLGDAWDEGLEPDFIDIAKELSAMLRDGAEKLGELVMARNILTEIE